MEISSEEFFGSNALLGVEPLRINIPEAYRRLGHGDELLVWYITVNNVKFTVVEESGAFMNMGPDIILEPKEHIAPGDIFTAWFKEEEDT